jgi:luciferase family oxidoreductase group 1
MLSLGVLDQSPISPGGTAAQALQGTLELARICDRLGYSRYWLAEHHNSRSFASATPEILIGRIATETRRLRVGSGGVLLQHYSPLKVAEAFRMLEALYPGRIDLGIGRSSGADPHITTALQPGPEAYDEEEFPYQVQLLDLYLDDRFEGETPEHDIRATPVIDTRPELWLLGSGVKSASYASQLGHPFCFAHFINWRGGQEVLRLYREKFQPAGGRSAPKAALAIAVLVADTEEKAKRLAASNEFWSPNPRSGFRVAPIGQLPPPSEAAEENPSPNVVGSPEQVREKLLAYQEIYGVDEFFVLTITDDFADRVRSYELLADALEIAAPPKERCLLLGAERHRGIDPGGTPGRAEAG